MDTNCREPPRSALQCGHGPKTVENTDLKQFVEVWQTGFNAATARRPWRTTQCQGQDRSRAYASMRPRPEDRGEPRKNGVRLSGSNASMRPRPEDRGEPWKRGRTANGSGRFNAATARRPWRTIEGVLATLASQVGFNAATARRPWRTGSHQCLIATVRCFNAATARRPWRTCDTATLYCPRNASMRPRPEDRGEPGGPDRIDADAEELQCGHGPKTVENEKRARRVRAWRACFNAATARRPWRTPASGYERETAAIASMRPRPEDRGERVRNRRDGGREPASMRPRPEDRGELGTLTRPISGIGLLQCGHGPKTVENRLVVVMTGTGAIGLQCGHGPKTVENRRDNR